MFDTTGTLVIWVYCVHRATRFAARGWLPLQSRSLELCGPCFILQDCRAACHLFCSMNSNTRPHACRTLHHAQESCWRPSTATLEVWMSSRPRCLLTVQPCRYALGESTSSCAHTQQTCSSSRTNAPTIGVIDCGVKVSSWGSWYPYCCFHLIFTHALVAVCRDRDGAGWPQRRKQANCLSSLHPTRTLCCTLHRCALPM